MRAWRKWAALLLLAGGIGCRAMSVEAGTIYDSPYVTFSPDGMAWTTNAGDRNIRRYADDGSEDIDTGIRSSLREPAVGEHYYRFMRRGSLPVGKWKVQLRAVNCCHNNYPNTEEYHGISYARQICLKSHFSAWQPVCADCGEMLTMGFLYMSREAAASIDHLDFREGFCYYYLCPFNNNLEQGYPMETHLCKTISANRYRVEYLANTGDDVYGGYMLPSYHMYNNASTYEGEAVTPQTHLNKNTYTRIGWKFVGWNTRGDGSGVFYGDEEEIRNLCTGDYLRDHDGGTVKLYAVWERVFSTLEIDPAGGLYRNSSDIVRIKRGYGSVYTPDPEALTPPPGYCVSFETCGGDEIPSRTGTRHFAEWKEENVLKGRWEKDCYLFSAPDGCTDRIAAVYADDPIQLPLPHKDNASFGGWFYDAQFSRPAGKAGDSFVPRKNVTLYAQWVELVLSADDNYLVNGGIGAVNLNWSQKDGTEKLYKVYRSQDANTWQMVRSAGDISEDSQVRKSFSYSGKTESYTVPYSGFYSLDAYGAQGGDYLSYAGGAGGEASGRFWLEKGEVLQITVGGKDGYNGGGTGDTYANGGGCTTVYSADRGLLLTAGGGGGAAQNGDGSAGGGMKGLMPAGMKGESGAAGGGGGYLGGHAGELIVHHHVEGVCNHQHQGSPNQYGGCYTEKVLCGKALKHEFTRREDWFWAGSTERCNVCGAVAALGEPCTGHYTLYCDCICPVHQSLGEYSMAFAPDNCPRVKEYAPNCGKSEEYICGYDHDGYVISSKPAYGGSNYVNPDLAASSVQKAGVRLGNGQLILSSEDVGYQECLGIDGVAAPDQAPPGAIDVSGVSKTAISEERILISWERPQDAGTPYYHMAESYRKSDTVKLCVSNITLNTLISGIKGYYYCVDEHPGTTAEPDGSLFTPQEQVQVDLTGKERYLHVRPVDIAGNPGPVTHIPLGSLSEGDKDVAWPVYTRQLVLEQGPNVYAVPEDGIFYVKGDGATPFVIDYKAYMQGIATEEYQLNYVVFRTVDTGGQQAKNIIEVPSCAISGTDTVFCAQSLSYFAEGRCFLQNDNYTEAVRSRRNREIAVTQRFVLDEEANGRVLEVSPAAGADFGEAIVWSDPELDVLNGIKIIGDGEPPLIRGTEQLENLVLIDRRNGRIRLRLSAADELSGLREMRLNIHNLDNDALRVWQCGEEGFLEADITADEPVFSGDFTIEVYAVDRVGNEITLTYRTTEFDLQAEVERVLEPHTPVFKRGESGVLHVTTWGYADRVEIEFPEELTVRGEDPVRIYEYEDGRNYRQEEHCAFMVPLYTPENVQYTVTVRAYKGDKMLERYPNFSVIGVEGTVLDEIRTRLR